MSLGEIIQKSLYPLITVIITVHAFVFYSIYVISGESLKKQHNVDFVLDAVNKQGGVYMFGTYLPIWAVILVEIGCAFFLEIVVAYPLSLKMALSKFDPKVTNETIFNFAIISSTVSIMCPAMSFLASFFFYPYNIGFNVLTLIANWFQLICYNFPFALFMQTFVIQPFLRNLFKFIFGSMEKKNKSELQELEKSEMKNIKIKKNEDISNKRQYENQMKEETIDISNSTLVDEMQEEEEKEIVEVVIN